MLIKIISVNLYNADTNDPTNYFMFPIIKKTHKKN